MAVFLCTHVTEVQVCRIEFQLLYLILYSALKLNQFMRILKFHFENSMNTALKCKFSYTFNEGWKTV